MAEYKEPNLGKEGLKALYEHWNDNAVNEKKPAKKKATKPVPKKKPRNVKYK